MKVNYSHIMENYNTNASYLAIDILPALEADEAATAAEKVATGNERGIDVIGFIRDLIKKIKVLIQTAIQKISNRFKLMMESDSGFKVQLRTKESSVEPVEAVRLICYNYNQSFIDNAVRKCSGECKLIINKLVSGNSDDTSLDIINMTKDELMNRIYGSVFTNEKFDDTSAFINKVRETYRGEKKETLFKKSDLPGLIKLADGHPQMFNMLKKNISELIPSVDHLTTTANRANAANISESQKRKFISTAKRASEVYNFLSMFINYVYELKLESLLSARIIVKKLYRF